VAAVGVAKASVGTGPVVIAAIVVYVNSEVVATGWTWVEFTNEIVFDVPPINGSEVVVRYPAALTCG
jgi:hypothetical protein